MNQIGKRHVGAGAAIFLSMILAAGCMAEVEPSEDALELAEPSEGALGQDVEALNGGCTCNFGNVWCKNPNGDWYNTGNSCGGPGGAGDCKCSGGKLWCKSSSGSWVNTGQPCGGPTTGNPGGGQCVCKNNHMLCKDQFGIWQDQGSPCWGPWFTGGTSRGRRSR